MKRRPVRALPCELLEDEVPDRVERQIRELVEDHDGVCRRLEVQAVSLQPDPRRIRAREEVVDEKKEVRLSASLETFEEEQSWSVSLAREPAVESFHNAPDVRGRIGQVEEIGRPRLDPPPPRVLQVLQIDDPLDSLVPEYVGARCEEIGVAHGIPSLILTPGPGRRVRCLNAGDSITILAHMSGGRGLAS